MILTGAGISAESGIATFRDQNGLWENHRIEDVATPEAFTANPSLVHRFYNERRKKLLGPDIKPSVAHQALARLQDEWGDSVLLVTQNIDNLHERGGSSQVLHMHGELLKARCNHCRHIFCCEFETDTETLCPSCEWKGGIRPHIVWFGEMPFEMDRIYQALDECELFIAVGTSGEVYPAAGFVAAVSSSARTIEVNLKNSSVSSRFKERRVGPATEQVPLLVEELLNA